MKLVKKFLRDRSGNFGLITAILLLPMLGAIGLVIDYSNASMVYWQLMNSADAAALGAISGKSKGYVSASNMTGDGEISVAQDDAKKIFLANAANFAAIAPEQVLTSVTKTKANVTSTVTFSADVPTYFMHLFGRETVTVSGKATAVFTVAANGFADYHLLLDNTPSMGLGATADDMDDLKAATGCAFACHIVWSNGKVIQDSEYMIARREGIKLRIDALSEAVVNVVDYARTAQGDVNQFRFAAYSFGKAALAQGHQIAELSGLTVDLLAVRKAVAGLELMSTPGSGHNDNALTSFDTSLTLLGNEIKQDGGEGKTASDRAQVVLLVTDGVGNSIKPKDCTGIYDGNKGHCFEPIDLKFCDQLKERNIKIAVLYTTYFPIDDHLYNTYVKTFADEIGPTLKACASPDLYSEVGMEEDMEAALRKLFIKAAPGTGLRLAS